MKVSPQPMRTFVVAWEYSDGSGGRHDFNTYEEAYQYARQFFADPARVWINDEQIQKGFIVVADDTSWMF